MDFFLILSMNSATISLILSVIFQDWHSLPITVLSVGLKMQITLPLRVSALSSEADALDNVLNDDTADPYAVAASASDDRMPPCFYLNFDVLVPTLDSCFQPPWPHILNFLPCPVGPVAASPWTRNKILPDSAVARHRAFTWPAKRGF